MARRHTLSTCLLITLFLVPITQLGEPTLAQAPPAPPVCRNLYPHPAQTWISYRPPRQWMD
jgi:hypothetical protein